MAGIPIKSRPGSPAQTATTVYGSPTIEQIPLPASSRPSTSHTSVANSPIYGSPRNAATFLAPPALGSSRPSNSTSSDSLSKSQPELTDAEKALIIRRHLLSALDQRTHAASLEPSSTATLSSSPLPSTSGWGEPSMDDTSAIDGEDEEYPTPYSLPGGDIVAPIYKWAAAAGEGDVNSATGLRRSKSLVSIGKLSGMESGFAERRASRGQGEDVRGDFGEESEEEGASAMGVREILEPGGFRRDFVIRRMVSRGEVTNGGANGTGRFTKSFVDFLSIYGQFAGEDLEEIDEEDEDETGDDEEDDLEYHDDGRAIPAYQGGGAVKLGPDGHAVDRSTSERTPLFRRTTSRGARASGEARGQSRKRSSSVGQHGDATVTQAVLMLLKSFVGTGVLFLGKAFYNGGIVFSTIVLCFIAMISLYSFLLLVETRLVIHGSFGDIGGILYGKYMRWMILFSIVMSQIGFVAAYTIFVAQNLQAFFMAVSNCKTYIPIVYLILGQLVIFLPLAMIRNIQKLSGTALIADAFILFGLVYIFSNEIAVLADNGLADVKLFNAKDFPLLIGTAVFSFEGIGLVIPITESMKDPHQFPRVLTGVMIGVMFLFAGAGALAYAAYGSAIQTVVFVNLPQEDKFVNAAQFLYSIAILLSTPLQLFPAVRIMENGIFSRSGKHSSRVKWTKNGFRTLVVVGCTVVAWLGAADLDKFVSLIGSVACVPLCFCYPALLHYKACAVTRRQKIADGALFVFGCLAAIYTTSQTIKLLSAGETGAPPTFGKCPPHV